MAEGFAREIGGGKVEPWSAGSQPSGQVNLRAVEFMKEKEIDLGFQESKGLDELPEGVKWDYLVTMGCGDACPQLPARVRLDWDIRDPKALSDDEFRGVRDQIETQVRELVNRVTQDSKATSEGKP
jgi:arsenate reductase (thioredoxin)